jgi:hypothetical protein
MARGQDLAGLAALAGLAYMAHKKGKGQETTGVDPDAAMGATGLSSFDAASEMGGAPERVDAEAMADMGPRGSRAKVNTESGDLYYPEGAPAPAAAPTRSIARAPAAKAPAARAPGNPDLEKGMSRGSGAGRASRYDYSNEGRGKERLILGNTTGSTEEGMKGYVPRRAPKPLTEVQRPGTRVKYENTDTSDMTYKKGGKTKKMASGGMTSASKRADGIASRGKTKCKMY